MVAVVIGLPFVSWSQDLSNGNSMADPQRQLENFQISDGFKIELVASEKEGIIRPVEIKFDDAGRLWTQTARMFPLDPIMDLNQEELRKIQNNPEELDKHPSMVRLKKMFRGKIPGEDQILILEGLNSAGDLNVQVWKDGLTSPMSLLPYKTGAFVAQGSEIFFLDDADGDGAAETRIPLFTGFGFTDSHAMAHGLVKGPGNWIHFSHGGLNRGVVKSHISGNSTPMNYSKIARFSTDGSQIELLNSGLNNIWGYSLKNDGLWYGSEANDLGYSVTPMQPGMGFPGIGNDRLRSYQPFMPSLHTFRVGGTGLSGLAFSNDLEGAFFGKYNDAALLANPVTGSINVVRINRNAKGEIQGEHLEDLLQSDDEWFRPVDIQFGPDGCLYIADWCHTIVSHNEVEVKKDPDHKKLRGRIWRICPEYKEEREIPDFYKMDAEELPEHLSSASIWARRAAWSQMAERPAQETVKLVPVLEEIVLDKNQDVSTRMHALWSLESMGKCNVSLIKNLLKDPSPHLQREALRVLASVSLPPVELAGWVTPFLFAEDSEIRAQVLRTLGEVETADMAIIELLVSACRPELSGEDMEVYEREQERFLARRSLEQYPDELYEYLTQKSDEPLPLENRLWAMMALPEEQQIEIFHKIWNADALKDFSPSTFLGLLGIADDPEIFAALYQMIKGSEPKNYLSYALENHAQIDLTIAGKLFREPVKKLLDGKEEGGIVLAVEAVSKLKITDEEILLWLFRESEDLSLHDDLLKIWSKKPTEYEDVFISIAKDERVDLAIRSAALNILTKEDRALGESVFAELWKKSTPSQKKQLIEIFSFSENGSEIILSRMESGAIGEEFMDQFIAERIDHLIKDERSHSLLVRSGQRLGKGRSKKVKKQVEEHLKIVEKKEGIAAEGEKLFENSCLSCHQLGDRGYDFAPALDGSAYRSTKALLTAIIEPDLAVESGYSTYRVTKDDGSVVEGLLYKKNDRGTTLAFKGGSKLFISREDIISEGYLFGPSFMPSGLMEDYSEQEVADLLAFIKTLE